MAVKSAFILTCRPAALAGYVLHPLVPEVLSAPEALSVPGAPVASRVIAAFEETDEVRASAANAAFQPASHPNRNRETCSPRFEAGRILSGTERRMRASPTCSSVRRRAHSNLATGPWRAHRWKWKRGFGSDSSRTWTAYPLVSPWPGSRLRFGSPLPDAPPGRQSRRSFSSRAR